MAAIAAPRITRGSAMTKGGEMGGYEIKRSARTNQIRAIYSKGARLEVSV